jgi:hypothetical protein
VAAQVVLTVLVLTAVLVGAAAGTALVQVVLLHQGKVITAVIASVAIPRLAVVGRARLGLPP